MSSLLNLRKTTLAGGVSFLYSTVRVRPPPYQESRNLTALEMRFNSPEIARRPCRRPELSFVERLVLGIKSMPTGCAVQRRRPPVFAV